jgi:hypothetical protein
MFSAMSNFSVILLCVPTPVMAGHSRSKNGVASLAYARPSTPSLPSNKDVDARHKAGHDELN